MSTPPTDRELIEALLSLSSSEGRTPYAATMEGSGEYSADLYIDRFGSWEAAIERAGLDPAPLAENRYDHVMDRQLDRAIREATWSAGIDASIRRDLLAEIQLLATELGNRPTVDDMNAYGRFSVSTYSRHFGRWSTALDLLGFDSGRGPIPVSDEDLLCELRRLADERGEPPRMTDMNANGDYSATIYYTRFGSWEAALEAADLL